MHGRPLHVRLTLDTWLFIVCMSGASAVVAERLALRERTRETQQLREALEHRLSHAQKQEARALDHLGRQVSQARAQADAAIKDAASFRSEVADVQGQLKAQKSKNAQRLQRIETKLSEAKKTGEQTKVIAEHVDETVQKVAPPPVPWWRRVLP